MKKIIAGCTAAVVLALVPVSSASAIDVTVGAETWSIRDADTWGVSDVRNDAFDSPSFALSIDGGTNYQDYNCRSSVLTTITTVGSGKIATCDELVTVVTGLNVRGFAYIYPDALKAAVTYKVTNTTSASIDFKWEFDGEFGEGDITDSTFASIFSAGDGTDSGTTPSAFAWGPTTQSCSAAAGVDDNYDAITVTSETCSLAAGASIGLTFFLTIDDNDSFSDVNSAAGALFSDRTSDSTLAAGIPSGLTNGNWGITGTLDVSTVPAAADPFDYSETMTLTGDAVLGSYMTVAFKTGVTPVGDFYDVWMCPNKDVKPIDEVNEGDCIAVTFWNRGSVASYDQETTAKTMTWLLSNESQPGLIAQGGASYLDSSGEPINMDPPTEDGGWCAYEGWYMIVHDYIDGGGNQTGTHSNWSPALGAAGCSEAAAGSRLADTGLDGQQTSLVAAFGLIALLAGLGIAVNRRRGADSL